MVCEQLAKGLLNSDVYAYAFGEAAKRHEAFLDELRTMAQNRRYDATVRSILATGLSNDHARSLREGDVVSRDALLDELRKLAHSHPV